MLPALPSDLRVPVAVYVSVICAMAHCALLRFWSEEARAAHGQTSLAHGLRGALLFVLSDSVLALGRFQPRGLQIPCPKLWVMTTYYSAQLFIAMSAITKKSLD